jgi:MoaA/NifB/PqqE/SkfB family radical SAM enzyme
MIQCILTRRCKLACTYCSIAGNIDYEGRPPEYSDGKTLRANEADTDYWVDILGRYFRHDPAGSYFVLLGGEPFIRPDMLTAIVRKLNEWGAKYTIATAATGDLIQARITSFLKDVGHVYGLAVSVDPGFELDFRDDERGEYAKSRGGFEVISDIVDRGLADDPSAVMTISRENVHLVPGTMKYLIDRGINVFLNLLVTQKTVYYDFPGKGEWQPCARDAETERVFEEIGAYTQDRHTTRDILPLMYASLPEEFNCHIENDLHNVTIEPDGALRLCTNIRGVACPALRTEDVLDESGCIIPAGMKMLQEAVAADKNNYCQRCALTCMMMSSSQTPDQIQHTQKEITS